MSAPNVINQEGRRYIAADALPPQEGAKLGGKFPLNRVVTFLGPFLSLLAGAVAAWLFNHFPGLNDYIDENTVEAQLASGAVFVVGALATQLSQLKWLAGWQKYENAVYDPAIPVDGAGNIGAGTSELDDHYTDEGEDKDTNTEPRPPGL